MICIIYNILSCGYIVMVGRLDLWNIVFWTVGGLREITDLAFPKWLNGKFGFFLYFDFITIQINTSLCVCL